MFKSQFQIQFTNLNSKWDDDMARIIYLIWETCQMFGICQWPNGKYGQVTRGRNHLMVLDFRISGIFSF